MPSIANLAGDVLRTVEGADKAAASRAAAEAWRASKGLMAIGNGLPPERPSRPLKPELLPPNKMPRRRGQSDEARAALLHAVLHIELNAIDLAWDMVARFTHLELPRQFYDDWVKVADEEAKHFTLLATRLQQLGYKYGDFPAHDGLWEAAVSTKDDLAGRLAVVPMVLEARGLDVTPAMIARFAKMGDTDSVHVLKIILTDEVEHVAIGSRWFLYYCDKQKLDAEKFWQQMVRKFFKGLLKPPFNTDARSLAGLPPEYYLPLAKIDPIKETKKG
ncbi:MAG: ferritin-like domain-containing protein [Sneathiella sp.]